MGMLSSLSHLTLLNYMLKWLNTIPRAFLFLNSYSMNEIHTVKCVNVPNTLKGYPEKMYLLYLTINYNQIIHA